jgi:hypothetical protein
MNESEMAKAIQFYMIIKDALESGVKSITVTMTENGELEANVEE